MDRKDDVTAPEADDRQQQKSPEGPIKNGGQGLSAECDELRRVLCGAATLIEARKRLRHCIKTRWPEHGVFVALFDPNQQRFQFILPDGRLVPKPASNFALDHFLTFPDRQHSYFTQVLGDPDLIGELDISSTDREMVIHSLAVPIRNGGLLRGTIGICQGHVFSWEPEDVQRLAALGAEFLDACETIRHQSTRPMAVLAPAAARDAASDGDRREGEHRESEWLRDRLQIHETLERIVSSMLQPHEIVTAVCSDLALCFSRFDFTVSVHYPESRLFVVHSPARESRRMLCDETIEGYFLHQRDEEILAIEDYSLWTAPAPLQLERWFRENSFRAGLFAAARLHGNLIGVAGLQSDEPTSWEGREVEILLATARSFALAYYHAMLCENLTYSCRETQRQLEEAQREANTWQHQAEFVQTAATIAHQLAGHDSVDAVMDELKRLIEEHCPDCRVTVQRYVEASNAFAFSPASGEPILRPARDCVQNLFLNNLPVAHIICDSPQDIAYYRDIDPRLVAECEQGGVRAYCTTPIFIGDRLWGAISTHGKEPGACSAHADLLAEIGRAVGSPIRFIEMQEAAQRKGAGDQSLDFRETFEGALVGLLVVDPASGKILQANQKAAELLDVSMAQLCGCPLDSVGRRQADQAVIRDLVDSAAVSATAVSPRISLQRSDGKAIEAGLRCIAAPYGRKSALIVSLDKASSAQSESEQSP